MNNVTKCNVFDSDGNWYFAIWCGVEYGEEYVEEYDSNGQIDDAETESEAVAWAEKRWPNAVVTVVDGI